MDLEDFMGLMREYYGNNIQVQRRSRYYYFNLDNGSEDPQLHALDKLVICRYTFKLVHESWSLTFSRFQNKRPCHCCDNHYQMTSLASHGPRPGARLTQYVAYTYSNVKFLAHYFKLSPFPYPDLVVYEELGSISDDKIAYRGLLNRAIDVIAHPTAESFNTLAEVESRGPHEHILGYHVTSWYFNNLYHVYSSYDCSLSSITWTDYSHKERIKIIQGIVSGLKELHGIGICHGDLSPSNIVIRDDKVMLYGATNLGSRENDIFTLGKVIVYCVFGDIVEFDNISLNHVAWLNNCDERQNPELYDLVFSLFYGRRYEINIFLSGVIQGLKQYSKN